MERISLSIEGMSCGHCVRAVTGALRQLEGVEVEGAEVGAARVSYDPARVRPEEIVSAIEAEGYAARSAGREG